MNETDGLLADAAVAEDNDTDNQQQQETISHTTPETQPAETQVGDDTDEVIERPDWYPEKFWNSDDGPDIENLVKSYTELQKKFSQGKHKAPDQYDTSMFADANIPDDDELFNTYRDWAKENGISQDAFETLASKFIDMAGDEAQQAQISYEEEHKKLGNNADAVIKSMTDWASGLVRKGVWGEDDFEEFKIMGGTAQGLRALQKVRSYYGDQSIPIDVGQPEGAPSKEELQSMVAKPEYQSDPAYRAKVEKMFEQVYGSQDYQPM
tara:strand:+ start:178 stop:975 length:798 start_codon:yes stop_codon:yes gene_type:complete